MNESILCFDEKHAIMATSLLAECLQKLETVLNERDEINRYGCEALPRNGSHDKQIHTLDCIYETFHRRKWYVDVVCYAFRGVETEWIVQAHRNAISRSEDDAYTDWRDTYHAQGYKIIRWANKTIQDKADAPMTIRHIVE